MLLRYVIRRLILAVPMMLGISLVLFLIYNIVQVDPLVMLVDELPHELQDGLLLRRGTLHWQCSFLPGCAWNDG